jgi:hypothetical protein
MGMPRYGLRCPYISQLSGCGSKDKVEGVDMNTDRYMAMNCMSDDTGPLIERANVSTTGNLQVVPCFP